MAAFPTLASGQDSSKYKIGKEDVSMSTEMEGGYVASRPRHTRIPRKKWTTGYTELEDADKALLLAFYDTVKGGSVIFTWYNSEDLQTYSVRWKGALEFTYTGKFSRRRWSCEIMLEQA